MLSDQKVQAGVHDTDVSGFNNLYKDVQIGDHCPYYILDIMREGVRALMLAAIIAKIDIELWLSFERLFQSFIS